jgi:hypothetical protein
MRTLDKAAVAVILLLVVLSASTWVQPERTGHRPSVLVGEDVDGPTWRLNAANPSLKRLGQEDGTEGSLPSPAASEPVAYETRPPLPVRGSLPRPPVRVVEPHTAGLVGKASWYCSPALPTCHHSYPPGSLVAAACLPLRRVLGPRWRGSYVDVSAGGRSVRVRLVDWCGSKTKTIDLYAAAFERLAPLSRGVVGVVIST